jgi:predicted ester cyclase
MRDTTTEDIKPLLQRFEHAMNARQSEQLDELVAPNFVRHCQATPWINVRSLEQFKEFLRLDAAMFPDNVQTFERILVEGDMAAIWATYEGTQTGHMGPFPPSGKKAKFNFSGVLRVERGKIAELWLTWDNLTILTQLGHMPPASGS